MKDNYYCGNTTLLRSLSLGEGRGEVCRVQRKGFLLTSTVAFLFFTIKPKKYF